MILPKDLGTSPCAVALFIDGWGTAPTPLQLIAFPPRVLRFIMAGEILATLYIEF
ncbi:MAG: hypothetical protein KME19_22190 [Microcoleus vaginatus WJT46-NPBG5]|nr:hypothetical protein [Microcoleus vaginatus WJT46-NPBG5]